MNAYIALACLLAALGLSQGNPIGTYGHGLPWNTAPIVVPAAVSTANVVKAAPIPVIRTHLAPVVTAPVLHSVPYGSYGLGGPAVAWGRHGWGNHGYGWGNHGYGWGNHGYGWGNHGYGHGYGWGAHGHGWGHH